MAFPTNPSNNQLHHEGSRIWRYNNLLWTLNTNAGVTKMSMDARGINGAGGNWHLYGTVLNRPIPPNRRFVVLINMFGGYLDDLDLAGEYAKYTITAYEGGTQGTSNYYVQMVPDTYAVDQYYHGLFFEIPFSSNRWTTRLDVRCDWYIRQEQAGDWVQWRWDWLVISD